MQWRTQPAACCHLLSACCYRVCVYSAVCNSNQHCNPMGHCTCNLCWGGVNCSTPKNCGPGVCNTTSGTCSCAEVGAVCCIASAVLKGLSRGLSSLVAVPHSHVPSLACACLPLRLPFQCTTGPSCSQPLPCVNGICDPLSGGNTCDCDPNYMGPLCNQCTPCNSGPNCTTVCSNMGTTPLSFCRPKPKHAFPSMAVCADVHRHLRVWDVHV